MDGENENELIPKATFDKAQKDWAARHEAAEARAVAAEKIVCEAKIREAAQASGCSVPDYLIARFKDKTKLVDGQVLYHEEHTSEDGETVTLPITLAKAIEPIKADPGHANIFGGAKYDLAADGKIDRKSLTQDQWMELRKTAEGRRAIGLA